MDNLRDVIPGPYVALLVPVPGVGVGETFCVNGRANINAAPGSLGRFEVDGKLPRTVMVVKIEAANHATSLPDPAIVRQSSPAAVVAIAGRAGRQLSRHALLVRDQHIRRHHLCRVIGRRGHKRERDRVRQEERRIRVDLYGR